MNRETTPDHDTTAGEGTPGADGSAVRVSEVPEPERTSKSTRADTGFVESEVVYRVPRAMLWVHGWTAVHRLAADATKRMGPSQWSVTCLPSSTADRHDEAAVWFRHVSNRSGVKVG